MSSQSSSSYFLAEKVPPAPFVPSFGATPPSFVGRDAQIADICAQRVGCLLEALARIVVG